jgi:DNA replication protein DnaC
MTTAAESLEPFIRRLEQFTDRRCRVCGQTFRALGFLAVCEACEGKPEPVKSPPKRELGDSWPMRHREKLNTMQGPGADKARQLLPLALDGSMIVLAGDRGRGKTQIATWLAWQRGQQGKPCGLYAKAFDLFSDVKGTWGKQSADSETKVMDRYKNAAFLCLDECHERGETDWENRTMRNVLDHRYDSCLPTVLIGNWTKAEEIGDSLGASITDRITETGGVVWCEWQSYRVAA